MPSLNYRLGSVDDIDAVFALNDHSFSEAWSKQSLLEVMLAGYDLYVCEAENKLLGYALSHDILDEIHIMQIAVHPQYQRQGIGSQLTQNLLHDKSEQTLVLLEVRASNVAAQILYQGLGFQHIGHRKAYYPPEKPSVLREDAIVMQLNMSELKQRVC